MSQPQAVIIAGPNGSGKSTSATVLLPDDMPFVNADMIAQRISGASGTPGDINAGRLLVQQVDELQSQGADFAFETTLATKMLSTRVKAWHDAGYRVHLFFFWLPSAELAIHRVASRVRAGGHDVPDDTVRRRYDAGLRNFFELYRPLVHTWRLYDNSGGGDPRLIAKMGLNGELVVDMLDVWRSLADAFDR